MATDFYMKIGDIKGSADDYGHRDWMETLSFSHGMSQTMTSSDRSAGNVTVERCNHQDLTFTKYIDKATPDLNVHCSQGTVFPKAELRLWRASGRDDGALCYYEVIMTEVLISSVSISGAESGLPTETVSVNYGTIEWRYAGQSMGNGDYEDGPKISGWDIRQNQKL